MLYSGYKWQRAVTLFYWIAYYWSSDGALLFHVILQIVIKKSRIRETPTLSTDAEEHLKKSSKGRGQTSDIRQMQLPLRALGHQGSRFEELWLSEMLRNSFWYSFQWFLLLLWHYSIIPAAASLALECLPTILIVSLLFLFSPWVFSGFPGSLKLWRVLLLTGCARPFSLPAVPRGCAYSTYTK